MEWLDGVRAYAVAGVVAVHVVELATQHHSSSLDHELFRIVFLGQYGVQLFFVISAVTVYYTLGRYEFQWPRFRSWLIKRFFRIAPLYYTAIPIFYALDRVMNWGRSRAHRPIVEVFNGHDLLANLLFLNTWTPHGNNNVVPGGWSIGVEMMFYLIAPVIFYVFYRKSAPAIYTLAAFVCVGITGLICGPAVLDSYSYFWFPTQLPTILCGVILCKISANWLMSDTPAPSSAALWAGALGAPALFLAIFRRTFGPWHDTLSPFLFGIAFSCLLVLARTKWKRAFDNRLATSLGKLSFSIYITHFMALEVLKMALQPSQILVRMPALCSFVALYAVTSLLTIGAASVTRWFIEDRGIHLGRRLAAPRGTNTIAGGPSL
jgi:peptidoglycan/LPS O-acetylase OafA/YrhL